MEIGEWAVPTSNSIPLTNGAGPYCWMGKNSGSWRDRNLGDIPSYVTPVTLDMGTRNWPCVNAEVHKTNLQ